MKFLSREPTNYTLTADADHSNFVPGTVFTLPLLSQTAVSTMTIDGFAPFQITTANFEFFLADASSQYGAGMGYGGCGYAPDANNLKGIDTLGALPSFSGNVTVTGSLDATKDDIFTTTTGDQVFTGFSGIATFNGEFRSSAVPEPTSMAIFGLGALGMAFRSENNRARTTTSRRFKTSACLRTHAAFARFEISGPPQALPCAMSDPRCPVHDDFVNTHESSCFLCRAPARQSVQLTIECKRAANPCFQESTRRCFFDNISHEKRTSPPRKLARLFRSASTNRGRVDRSLPQPNGNVPLAAYCRKGISRAKRRGLKKMQFGL